MKEKLVAILVYHLAVALIASAAATALSLWAGIILSAILFPVGVYIFK
jgi:hypothetical protein